MSIRSSYRERISGRKDIENELQDSNKQEYDVDEAEQLLFSDDSEKIKYFFDNFRRFENLNKKIAYKMIHLEVSNLIFENEEKFPGLIFDKKFAIEMAFHNQAYGVIVNIEKFIDLDKEVAYVLISNEVYPKTIVENIKEFKNLEFNKEFANKLINVEECQFFIDNIEKFTGLDREVADNMIRQGFGYFVIENKNIFDGLELDEDLALLLIHCDGKNILMENREKFTNVNFNKDFLLKAIKYNSRDFFIDYIDQFTGLDKEVSLALIESYNTQCVINNKDKFAGLELNKEIAILLIKTHQSQVLIDNVNEFNNLDKEIAVVLIKAGHTEQVIKNKDKFADLEFNKEIAMLIIDKNQAQVLVDNLNKFNNLDKEVALILVGVGYVSEVFYYKDKFAGLEFNKEIAMLLIEKKQTNFLVNYLNEFNNLDKEIAIALIEAGYTDRVIITKDKFAGLELNKEIAMLLIEKKQTKALADNLKRFNNLDKEIALALVEAGHARLVIVICDKDKFAGLELNKEIAMLMIEKKQSKTLVDYLNKFNNLDKEVALSLIEAGYGYSVIAITDEDKFAGLEFNKELAMLLIEFGGAVTVISFKDKFAGLELNKEIAMLIIKKKQAQVLSSSLIIFNNLDKEVALALIEAGQIDLVMGNKEKFAGLELNKEIAILIIEKRYSQVFLSNVDKFFGIDKEVITIILKNKEGNILCNYLMDESVKKMLGYELIPEALYEKASTTIKIILQANVFPMLCQEDFELLFNEKNSIQKTLSNFSVLELNVLAEQNKLQNLKWLGSEEECEGIFKKLKENGIDSWSDEHNISGPFERGSAIFGYKKMFSYILREGVSRHDKLYNFDKVIELFKISGLEAQEFYIQILDQVKRDGAEYDGGKSVHHLNTIANNFRGDISKVLQEAQEYGDIKGLQTLVKDLSTPEQIFKSWESLKKYAELCQLLGKKEILGQLKQLKSEGEGKEKLYKYIERLAFHPDISMQSVIQFWRNPEAFLGLLDIHTDVGLQNRKKPSNYIEIPNLDLTAEQLRDALVEGSLDQIQVFEPLEIEYELPARSMSVQAPFELIRDAIGMKSMNLVGKAQDPGKVFAEIQTFLKKSGIKINFRNYLFGEEKTDEEVESKIVEIVKKYYNPSIETVNYRAKINLKSDPDGVVAGNDTACCMPFGSGKNNIYTFNPVCSLFTLQRRSGDGVWRTVAQSVLTKDKNIGVNVADLIGKIQNPEVVHMQDVIPEELLRESKFTLACDNVELAPSVKGSELIHKQVELVYADFMAEYLSRFSVRDNLDNLQVVIGKGYSDSLTNLSQVDNLYIPSAPVGYSDKTHSTVYQLKPEKGSFVTRNVVEKNRESRGQELQTDIKGISSLTFEDSLPVAYIEGKAYRDNESLIQFLHNMENALIAKDINNATKNRANMSFKYTDKEGKVHGYLLAYEGIGSEGTEKLQGKNILYVADIASDGEVLASGRILMAALLEQYKKEYVDKGNPIPIFAQMREQTSYLIVKKQLDRYASKFGMKFTMEELGTNTVGGDVMHEVVLRLVV